MAFLLAPVWSAEWKIILIVLLVVAVVVCVGIIIFAARYIRRLKTKIEEEEPEEYVADPGGFNAYVNVDEYNRQTGYGQPYGQYCQPVAYARLNGVVVEAPRPNSDDDGLGDVYLDENNRAVRLEDLKNLK